MTHFLLEMVKSLLLLFIIIFRFPVISEHLFHQSLCLNSCFISNFLKMKPCCEVFIDFHIALFRQISISSSERPLSSLFLGILCKIAPRKYSLKYLLVKVLQLIYTKTLQGDHNFCCLQISLDFLLVTLKTQTYAHLFRWACPTSIHKFSVRGYVGAC